VTAISSMESVKMRRPAAIRESFRFGSVTRQKVATALRQDRATLLPGRGPFFEGRRKLGGGDRDQRRAVAEKNGEQAELCAGEDGEHQQGEAGDDAGENQWKKNEAAEESFPGKFARSSASAASNPRVSESATLQDATIRLFWRNPKWSICKKLAIPIER